MATNNTRVGEGAGECDAHALVLRALHQELIDYGLMPDSSSISSSSLVDMKQSSAGSFPALRYVCGDIGGGRVVEVRALAMFDDLIVNATATSISTREGDDTDGEEVRRRIKLDVSTWLPLFSSGDKEEAAGGGGGGNLHQQRHQVSAKGAGANDHKDNGAGGEEGSNCTLAAGGATSPSPSTATATATSPASQLKEAFRSRVLSGLLLHLCPPPRPFADLFGCGDELRRRILGMLGARDLATFGLTSRSAAVSAVSESLWAPLLQAEFAESERRDGTTVALPPPSSLDRAYHHRQRRSTNGGGGGGEGGGRSWRLYGELERRRRRREAKRRAEARERSRALQLMAFMGRRSRTPYPTVLPRGPYHTPGPLGPPVFPGYDWGPGIGDAADVDVSPLSPPASIWSRGGWPAPLRGWGRGPWRR